MPLDIDADGHHDAGMSNTRTTLPPASLCPECIGDGQVLAPVRLAFGEDDGLENVTCPDCGGSGRVRDTERCGPPEFEAAE